MVFCLIKLPRPPNEFEIGLDCVMRPQERYFLFSDFISQRRVTPPSTVCRTDGKVSLPAEDWETEPILLLDLKSKIVQNDNCRERK